MAADQPTLLPAECYYLTCTKCGAITNRIELEFGGHTCTQTQALASSQYSDAYEKIINPVFEREVLPSSSDDDSDNDDDYFSPNDPKIATPRTRQRKTALTAQPNATMHISGIINKNRSFSGHVFCPFYNHPESTRCDLQVTINARTQATAVDNAKKIIAAHLKQMHGITNPEFIDQ